MTEGNLNVREIGYSSDRSGVCSYFFTSVKYAMLLLCICNQPAVSSGQEKTCNSRCLEYDETKLLKKEEKRSI